MVDFFITLPFSTIEGKVIKKLTTMTMTFQKFLTKPLLKLLTNNETPQPYAPHSVGIIITTFFKADCLHPLLEQ